MLFCLNNHSITVLRQSGGGVELVIYYPDHDSPTGRKSFSIYANRVEALALALAIKESSSEK
jgi:hypothetical protein